MHFTCRQCGGELGFDPRQESLACPYCGSVQEVARSAEEIAELDFEAALAAAGAEQEMEERLEAKCASCGASTTFDSNVTSGECPFCGTNVVLGAHSTRLIKPKALLPFKVDRNGARAAFKKWVRGLWFAPNKLKRLASVMGGISGVYVPYWTYDCAATSAYEGERGDDYITTESYAVVENGKRVQRTRDVRKTRWTRVRGVVFNTFDDVLVVASHSLPDRYAERLEPWDLEGLVPYAEGYLSGFRAESYQVQLKAGFERAGQLMEPTIRRTVEHDIGGDQQHIHHLRTGYEAVTFKHVLLPIWISAYHFQDTVYRFLVNGRTGEVQGERPYSWVKIMLAVAAGIAAVACLIWLAG